MDKIHMDQPKSIFLMSLTIILMLLACLFNCIIKSKANEVNYKEYNQAEILQSVENIKNRYKESSAFQEAITKINNFSSIEEVENEIATIKDQIRKELIIELSDITQESYEKIEKKITNKRAYIKQLLQKTPYFHSHNLQIPSSMYLDLFEAMLEENISPYKINIDYKPLKKGSKLLAEANAFTLDITIYENLCSYNKNVQLFVYKHEIAHILLAHSFNNIDIIDNHLNKEKKSLYDLILKKLRSIEEREANIDAASKNSRTTYGGVRFQCFDGHVKILDNNEHCKEMILMYELMKRKEELS